MGIELSFFIESTNADRLLSSVKQKQKKKGAKKRGAATIGKKFT